MAKMEDQHACMMSDTKSFLSDSQFQQLAAFRKELHTHPEVSGNEHETAKRVLTYLDNLNPSSVMHTFGGTGIIATYDSRKAGPTLLFRAELDALPIQEINTFDYQSIYEGVSHKCGHDGHSTSLLGLATLLHENPPQKGKVHLLFQPAEEDGEGAKAMLADSKFEGIDPDFIFAYHNLPGYPLGEVVYRQGSFTAAVKSVTFKFHGKTAHAAEPEHGHNPALAIADILKGCEQLTNNEPSRADFKLITPIHIEMGEIAYGISAGYGELRLTIRTWTQEFMHELTEGVLRLAKEASDKYGMLISDEWSHEFSANQNQDAAVLQVVQASESMGYVLSQRDYPFKWGQDLGLFTQHFPGAMFGIGSGENCPALHNPDYDFPDELIHTGTSLFYKICENLLNDPSV